jgi:hypothetical protein
MLLILLVFCVVRVFFWGGRGVYVAHIVSFLCCVFVCLGGVMLLILLVFCVVFFGGLCCPSCYSSVLCVIFVFFWGVQFAHLVSFLCCVFVFVFGRPILLILLVFRALWVFWGVASMLLMLLAFCVVLIALFLGGLCWSSC